MSVTDQIQFIAERVREAAGAKRTLRVAGAGSKDFYGQSLEGEMLETRSHQGISAYEPTELVITARCGTPLEEVEKTLFDSGQILPFEPPQFGANATFGGSIAAGLSGPRRAANNGYYGAVRDYVLGCKIIDGRGDVLSFGGQVMKNVAGYDVSRLMAGSMGTLGVILEVSLKVLPKPVASKTLQLGMRDAAGVIRKVNEWGGQPLPITATAYRDGDLTVRLEGAESAVSGAAKKLGGESVGEDEAVAFWRGLRDQTDPFFAGAEPLWRLSIPATTVPFDLPGRQLIEWGGALRWFKGEVPAETIRKLAQQVGGHATLFRADDVLKKAAGVFTPLDPALAKIQQNLKRTFDPHGIFNRGRMYPNL